MKNKWKWDIRKAPQCSYMTRGTGKNYKIIVEVTPECLPSKSEADLIAAAPDLLFSAKYALVVLRANYPKGTEVIKSLESAIAKAEKSIDR